MKRSLRFSLFGVVVMAIMSNYGCNRVVSPDNNNPVPPLRSAEKQVGSANNLFAANLFTQVASQEQGKNFFISPLSVSMALAMTLNGAGGQTYTDMQKTLGFEGLSNEEINQSYQSLISMFQNLDPSVTFNIANSIWYRNTFHVLSSFIATGRVYFDVDKPFLFLIKENHENTIMFIGAVVQPSMKVSDRDGRLTQKCYRLRRSVGFVISSASRRD